jgi:hypothetical protein
MSFEHALRRYRADAFSDEDVTRSAGLSVRAWRELIKIRAVRTTTQARGRGRVRQCDATTLKRATVIAALNEAGFSLASSGRIAYFLPFHTLLYSLCDPLTILFRRFVDVDPGTGLLPRFQHPKTDWFDPDKPARADPETDWLVEIYDRRFVAAHYSPKHEPTHFGDLRNEGASFVAWRPLLRRGQLEGSATDLLVRELLPHRFIEFVEDWEDRAKVRRELKLLDYRYENHNLNDDPLRLAAEAAARSPVIKTTINISLALRRGLRRYLEIETPISQSIEV